MLKTMERKSQITKVLNGSNWQYKICDTVKPDLGIRISNFSKDDNKPCYRTYQGGSVVHLLRAIRYSNLYLHLFNNDFIILYESNYVKCILDFTSTAGREKKKIFNLKTKL